MDDDYYDEGADTKKDVEEDVSSTALLPKSILLGKTFNVGDEVVLKITGIHDDEVQVEYASGEDTKEPEKEPEPDMEQPDKGEDLEPEPATQSDGMYD